MTLRTQAEKARDPETVARIVDCVAQALEQTYVSESGVRLDVNPPWLPFRKQARAAIEAMPDTLALIEALEEAERAMVETRQLVSEASMSGFVDEDAVRAVFVNNGSLSRAIDQIRKLTHD